MLNHLHRFTVVTVSPILLLGLLLACGSDHHATPSESSGQVEQEAHEHGPGTHSHEPAASTYSPTTVDTSGQFFDDETTPQENGEEAGSDDDHSEEPGHHHDEESDHRHGVEPAHSHDGSQPGSR